MNIEIGETTKEGFVSALLLRFENGLILRTEMLEWASKTELNETYEKFAEVVESLSKAGFKVKGKVNCQEPLRKKE